jgi:hypothetical protein
MLHSVKSVCPNTWCHIQEDTYVNTRRSKNIYFHVHTFMLEGSNLIYEPFLFLSSLCSRTSRLNNIIRISMYNSIVFLASSSGPQTFICLRKEMLFVEWKVAHAIHLLLPVTGEAAVSQKQLWISRKWGQIRQDCTKYASTSQISARWSFEGCAQQYADDHCHAILRHLSEIIKAFCSLSWLQPVSKHFAIRTRFNTVHTSSHRYKIGTCASQKISAQFFPLVAVFALLFDWRWLKFPLHTTPFAFRMVMVNPRLVPSGKASEGSITFVKTAVQ